MTGPGTVIIFTDMRATPKILKALREARGLSIRELAARAGISHVALLKIEAGGVDPRLGTLEALAEALGVSVVDLVAPKPRRRGRGKR